MGMSGTGGRSSAMSMLKFRICGCDSLDLMPIIFTILERVMIVDERRRFWRRCWSFRP